MSAWSPPSGGRRCGMGTSSWKATGSRRWGRERCPRHGGTPSSLAAGGCSFPASSTATLIWPCPRGCLLRSRLTYSRSRRATPSNCRGAICTPGFTTVVDLAVFDRAFLDRLEAAQHHPDIYDCGGALPLANGYPMAMVPKI